MPLPAPDPDAFRVAEAAFHRDGRAKAGLANLGPGAIQFAEMMDGTASFLLTKAPAKMKSSATAGGRVAGPLAGVPTPGDIVLGTYAMTSVVFNSLIESRAFDATKTSTVANEKCPCTVEATFDPTKDQVTIEGNTGTILTTVSVKATVNGSKITLDIKMKVEGEVRDAKTGAVLYKISNEATGHADGDSCPDASGVVTATMTFGGHEDYFDGSGAKTGSHTFDSFGGQLRIKVDDDAKLAGVDIRPSGDRSGVMLEIAARSAAPAFEKAWRSGMCIEVIIDPKNKDVDAESVTTITAKVKQKFEGTELDKPVQAKLTSGVKTIEPSAQKQKAPATFRYTAGKESGDQGTVNFESASNRGLGNAGGTYTVGGGWTISGTGTSNEDFQSVVKNDLRVTIKDLKVKADKDGALSGQGTMTLAGVVTTGAGICRGEISQTLPFTATGTLVGTSADGTLRLTLYTPANADEMVTMICTSPFGGSISQAIGATGHADRYGEALGTIELPAAGGTKTVSHTAAIGGLMNVAASGTFTVAKATK